MPQVRSNEDAFEICCRAYYNAINLGLRTRVQCGRSRLKHPLTRIGQMDFDLTYDRTKVIMAKSKSYCDSREHRIPNAGFIRNLGGSSIKFKQGSIAMII